MKTTGRAALSVAAAVALSIALSTGASASTIKGWADTGYSGKVLFDSTSSPTFIDFQDNNLESVKNHSGKAYKAYNTVWVWGEEVVLTFSNGHTHSNLYSLNNLIDHLRR